MRHQNRGLENEERLDFLFIWCVCIIDGLTRTYSTVGFNWKTELRMGPGFLSPQLAVSQSKDSTAFRCAVTLFSVFSMSHWVLIVNLLKMSPRQYDCCTDKSLWAWLRTSFLYARHVFHPSPRRKGMQQTRNDILTRTEAVFYLTARQSCVTISL